jgi:hypothetical protein
MSRERNLVNQSEEISLSDMCPHCQSNDIGPAKSTGLKDKFAIDLFSTRWLNCNDCGAVWLRKDKEETDEDRERFAKDTSI